MLGTELRLAGSFSIKSGNIKCQCRWDIKGTMGCSWWGQELHCHSGNNSVVSGEIRVPTSLFLIRREEAQKAETVLKGDPAGDSEAGLRSTLSHCPVGILV